MITSIESLRELVPTWYRQDFAFDVETTGIDPRRDRPLGIALTFADQRSYYIVFEHSVEDEDGTVRVREFCSRDAVADLLRGLFAQETVTMVAHNAKFDLHFLQRLGLRVHGCLADTMLAAKLVDENRDVDLKSLSRLVGMELVRFQDLPRYPGFPSDAFVGVPLEAAATYAMADTEATFRLWLALRAALDEEGLTYAFSAIVMPLLPVLQQMEWRGIAFDAEQARTLLANYEQMANDAYERIWQEGMRFLLDAYHRGEPIDERKYWHIADRVIPEFRDEGQAQVALGGFTLPLVRKKTPTGRMIGKPRTLWFNARSNDHISDLVYHFHKIRPPREIRLNKRQSGDFSVDKDTIRTLRLSLGDSAPPILDTILELRHAEKICETYLRRFLEYGDPEDHFALHTTFNQAVTATGRLSSSQPINLQNVPARGEVGAQLRGLFCARPRKRLLVADYAQMELRMIAHFSQDAALLSAFAEEKDLHLVTAAAFAQTTYEELRDAYEAGDPKARELRSLGKTGNFALIYGMAAPKFQRYLLVNNGYKIAKDEAQRMINQFNATYAGMTAWKERMICEAHASGFVRTITGRKRRLPNLFAKDRILVMEAERQAVNAIIQGSCADLMNRALVLIHHLLAPFGGYVLLQVHDEVVCEIDERFAELGAKLVEQTMQAITTRLHCPFKAECHVGRTWAEAKS